MENINLKLTKEEALVLFELLARYSETDKLEVIDQSEQRVLWNINGSLEKILAEPFSSDYKNILESARKKLRDGI